MSSTAIRDGASDTDKRAAISPPQLTQRRRVVCSVTESVLRRRMFVAPARKYGVTTRSSKIERTGESIRRHGQASLYLLNESMNRCDCLTLKLLTRLVRIRGKFDQGWFKLPVVLHQKKPVDVPLMLFTSRMVTKKRD